MDEQLPLFGTYRQSDPSTSRDAALSMTGHALGAQQQLVLATIAEIAAPASAYDVHDWLRRHRGHDLQQNVAARRCTDLERAGLVVAAEVTRPGSSGRQCKCYLLTDAGRRRLERVA